MSGKTVVITGANSGLGKATALEMAKMGARVILACRDVPKGVETARKIRKTTSDGQLTVMELDLSSLVSIRSFVQDLAKAGEQVHVLINNAGVYLPPYTLTEDGVELQMAVNYLGHFLLTVKLISLLETCAPSRVIFIVPKLFSQAQLDPLCLTPTGADYDPRLSYYNSKMATVLFATEFHNRTQQRGISTFCVIPKHSWTRLGRHMEFSWKALLFLPFCMFFVRSSGASCQTIVHCAASGDPGVQSGMMFSNCREFKRIILDNEDKLRKALWDQSEILTGVK